MTILLTLLPLFQAQPWQAVAYRANHGSLRTFHPQFKDLNRGNIFCQLSFARARMRCEHTSCSSISMPPEIISGQKQPSFTCTPEGDKAAEGTGRAERGGSPTAGVMGVLRADTRQEKDGEVWQNHS